MKYEITHRHKSSISTSLPSSARASRSVPQSLPLDERQVQNRAGGWTYEVEPMQMFRRWLVLGPGAGRGAYYATEGELVLEADNLTMALITSGDGIKLVDELAAMRPRVPKAGPSIFALALLASFGDVETKRYIAGKIKSILWTGTDMFTFFSYVNSMRGWGRAIERMANEWYDRNPLKLAQTMTKYRNREGWRHRDVLLKGSVRPNCPEAGMVFRYIVSRDKGNAEQMAASLAEIMGSDSPAAKYLLAIENCWAAAGAGDMDAALSHVIDNELPREVLPTELLKYDRTWEALLPHMGGVATIRSLGKMGSMGLLSPGHPIARKVCRRREDPAWIAGEKLHPAHLITAWSVYRQGHGDKGSLRWSVVPNIIGALETGFYLSFGNVEPIGGSLGIAVVPPRYGG